MNGTGVSLIGVTIVLVLLPEADDAFVPDEMTLVSLELAELVFAVVIEDISLPVAVVMEEAALLELTEVPEEVVALTELVEEVFVEAVFVDDVFVEEEDDFLEVLITRFSWLLLNNCSAAY